MADHRIIFCPASDPALPPGRLSGLALKRQAGLDGAWRVVYKSYYGQRDSFEIKVQEGRFELGQNEYWLELGDPVRLRGPAVNNVAADYNLESGCIRWLTPDGDQCWWLPTKQPSAAAAVMYCPKRHRLRQLSRDGRTYGAWYGEEACCGLSERGCPKDGKLTYGCLECKWYVCEHCFNGFRGGSVPWNAALTSLDCELREQLVELVPTLRAEFDASDPMRTGSISPEAFLAPCHPLIRKPGVRHQQIQELVTQARRIGQTLNFGQYIQLRLELESWPVKVGRLPDEAALRPEDLDFRRLGEAQCTRVDDTAMRGITVKQLARIREFITDHADSQNRLSWIDLAPPQYSPTSGQQIHLEAVNLYQVRTGYSLVELMCKGQQQPEYFVSHWWGEPHLDFIAAIEGHVQVRSNNRDGEIVYRPESYWICAYANNQHELGADIDPDPLKTSFYRAMAKARGVLLVLDPEATPFVRIWCMFEEAMVIQRLRGSLPLDFATVQDGLSRVITEGLTDEEEEKEAKRSSNGVRAKRDRQQKFPFALLERGYNIDIATAQASVAEDKSRILNNTLSKLSESIAVLSQDSQREVLHLDLSGCKLHLADTSLLTPGLLSSQRLRDCEVSFDGCKRLTDVSHLAESLASLNLVSLSLQFLQCKALHDVSALGALRSLASLQILKINLYDSGVQNVSELGLALAEMKALKQLKMDFRYSSTSPRPIGDALSELHLLTHLELDLGCGLAGLVSSLPDLGNRFGKMEALKDVRIMCSHLMVLCGYKQQGATDGDEREDEAGCIDSIWTSCKRTASMSIDFTSKRPGICEKCREQFVSANVETSLVVDGRVIRVYERKPKATV